MVKRPLHWAWSTVWTLCFDACGCLSKRRPLRAVDAEACFWGPVTCPKDRNKAPCNVGWLSLTVLSCVWPQYRKVDVLCVKYMPTYWFVGADLKAWISRWASSDKDSEPGSSVYLLLFVWARWLVPLQAYEEPWRWRWYTTSIQWKFVDGSGDLFAGAQMAVFSEGFCIQASCS